MPWQSWLVVGVLVVSGFPGTALAVSEVDILIDKLVEKGTLTTIEAGLIRQEISDTKAARHKELAQEIVPDSARNWHWKGDLRLREEFRNRTGSGQDLHRQRLRFRYGFEGRVTDQLKVGARLATGSTADPVSTNQSFNTAFNHKNFLLDQAYVSYHPEVPGLTATEVVGGMLPNPFWGVGPLVWDDDLNFDGAAVRLSKALTPVVTVFTNQGIFDLQTDVSEAATLWSTQGGVAVQPFPESAEELRRHLKITSALAYHDYKNVTNSQSENTAYTQAGGQKGNSADIQDLNLLHATWEVAGQYADVPFSAFGDWVHNTAVAAGHDGFQLGLKAGKARVPFDPRQGWEGGYYFERLAPDATFGPFTDSDFGNGGTNHRGHAYWLKFAVLKNSSVQLKYFNTQEVKQPKNHADTFQADWVTVF